MTADEILTKHENGKQVISHLPPRCVIIQQMRDEYAKRFSSLRFAIQKLPSGQEKTDLIAQFKPFFDHVVSQIDRLETDVAKLSGECNRLRNELSVDGETIERLKGIIINSVRHD